LRRLTSALLHERVISFGHQPSALAPCSRKSRLQGNATDWPDCRRRLLCRKSVRDEQLKPKLCTEVRGIFHWMLRGVADYRLNGMQYPQKVEVATSQYRESQDVIAQFVAAKCVLDVNAEVRFSELYSAYKYWADASREYMMPARKFTPGGRWMARWYTGIALLASAPRSLEGLV
jgi:hypothetical protein